MLKRAIVFCLFAAVTSPALGFALLGPFTPWMTTSNGYAAPGDLGGPMDLNEEYRWNLPVITYGFDPEFVAYFGEAGIAAVERAIGILTNLPPMAEIDLEMHDLRTVHRNFEGEALGYLDLSSFALKQLVRQLGLAEPARSAWNIRERTPEATNIIQRNFNPTTLQATDVVNEVGYGYSVFVQPNGAADAVEHPIDPLVEVPFAVAEVALSPGKFLTGLSRDDVGGLRYLYGRENINIEPLPADGTVPGGTNRPSPDIAPRPGIEKINFVRMDWNAQRSAFNPVTNAFALPYLANGILQTQVVQRVVTTPDIAFDARDLGGKRMRGWYGEYYFLPNIYTASDTARWQNLSQINGPNSGAGPGIIPSGARVTFNKIGKYTSAGPSLSPIHWASFDGTTNPPVVFQGTERLHTVTLDTYVRRSGATNYFTSVLLGTVGAIYDIESSTNLQSWTPFKTITNDNWQYGYFSFDDAVTGPKKFYRAIRQE